MSPRRPAPPDVVRARAQATVSRWRLAIACLLGSWLWAASPAHALDAVTLQLKWTHAFQFAGYYAAQAQGYYREAGLDVRIDEALPGVDPVKTVLAGKAQFGVGTSALLLARQAGQPVVVLAVIFQHSPYVLIARKQHATQSIHDLVGKRVMLEPQADEIVAYLKREGIPLDRIARVEHSYDPQDLINGKTDAIAAYVTNQPYFLDRAKFAHQIHTPRSAGIDFYGDNLFTSEQELKANPERVKAFRAASLRGWHYAMDHPKEIIDLILARYSQRHTRDYYLFEAKQMIPLLQPELIELGYMYSGRWRHIAESYADIGMLPRDFSLDGFLYDPNPKRDLIWLYRSLAAALLMIGTLSAVALYVQRNNRRLAGTLSERKSAEAALRESEARYHSLFDNSHAVTLLIDPDGGAIVAANPAAAAFYGWPREQLQGMRIDRINTLSAAEVAAEMQRAQAQQRTSFEFRHRLADGQVRDVEVFSGPVQVGGRSLLYSIVHDISGRKLAARQLAESEARREAEMTAALEAQRQGRLAALNLTEDAIAARNQAQAMTVTLGEQMADLRRWQQATLNRESRILTMKKEVNSLLAEQGQPPRYPSAVDAETEK